VDTSKLDQLECAKGSSMDDLRTFRAKSIQEAIATVRKELGPEASVLHTRKLPSGVWSWLLDSPRFEVTASATIQAPSRFDVTIGADANQEIEPTDDPELFDEPELPPPPQPKPRYENPAWRDATNGVSHRVASRRRLSGESQEFAVYTNLHDLGFEDVLAKRLAREALGASDGGGDSVLDRAAYLAAEQVPIAEPWEFVRGECKRIALVGPTGVGKTTTVAKLAADLRLRQRRRVGLITVDTYRIAAVDQLQTYASIIELPCEVASSPEEMQGALKRLRDCEVIFLDTAGRGPFDSLRMHELTRILQSFEADEVHLALSGTSRVPLLDTLVRRFDCVRPTHLTLTKIDECDGIGPLANWLIQSPLSLRFITTGQDVPQDYAEPTLEILSNAFLNRR
jgi:flagellar biosynthesis protein FlhF